MGGALATILEAALGEQMGLVAAMTAGALVASLSAIPLIAGGVARMRTLQVVAETP